MKTLQLVALCLHLAVPVAAHADHIPIPKNAPPAFQIECASCHVAFPPTLLTAADWRRVMGGLDKHYGDNASLDEPTRQMIEKFLVANASGWKPGAGSATGAQPRITTSAWFIRKHREVPRTVWKTAKVKSPANCATCHTRAAEGSYREREIIMPDGRRWEDD